MVAVKRCLPSRRRPRADLVPCRQPRRSLPPKYSTALADFEPSKYLPDCFGNRLPAVVQQVSKMFVYQQQRFSSPPVVDSTGTVNGGSFGDAGFASGLGEVFSI